MKLELVEIYKETNLRKNRILDMQTVDSVFVNLSIEHNNTYKTLGLALVIIIHQCTEVRQLSPQLHVRKIYIM
jgi:hypothetical protein